MSTNKNRGFTLIELLVVIAIIGVLSAVVLASLSTARSKGNDAAIRSDLSSIQTQAEIFYSNNNSYGSAATAGPCNTAGTMFVADTTIKNAVAAADAVNGSGAVACHADVGPSTKYAISAALSPGTGMFFCVDSTGNATTTIAGATTTNC